MRYIAKKLKTRRTDYISQIFQFQRFLKNCATGLYERENAFNIIINIVWKLKHDCES